MRTSASAALTLGLLLVPSCQSPTQITVVMSTDVPCADLRGTEITIGHLGEIETKVATATTQCAGDGDLGSIVLVPSGADGEEVAIKVVSGKKRNVQDCKPPYGLGCIVARRAVHYIAHSNLRLLIPMRASCDGIACTEGTTCVDGECKSARVVDPGKCVGAGCGEGDLAPSTPLDNSGQDAGRSDGGGGPRVIAIAAGSTHTCAALETGATRCWGDNALGQLGNGKDGPDQVQTRPVDVVQLGFAPVALAAGDGVSCALSGQGAARCWGNNGSGQLGDGTRTQRNVPGDVLQPDGGAAWSQISQSNAGHACALSDGRVVCWGANGAGQLGDNTTTDRPYPTEDWILRNATAVTTARGAGSPASASGGSLRAHTCALVATGAVLCWGGCNQDQCGYNASEVANPYGVSGVDTGVVEVAAGGLHTCAVLASGTVRCWGDTSDGKIPGVDPVAKPTTLPTELTGLGGFYAQHVAAGDKHTCALSRGGDVRCWGNNAKHQVNGTDSAPAIGTPTPVSLDGMVKALSAGANHTCALMTDGTVRCWGDNAYGQLGNGTRDPASAPVRVGF